MNPYSTLSRRGFLNLAGAVETSTCCQNVATEHELAEHGGGRGRATRALTVEHEATSRLGLHHDRVERAVDRRKRVAVRQQSRRAARTSRLQALDEDLWPGS